MRVDMEIQGDSRPPLQVQSSPSPGGGGATGGPPTGNERLSETAAAAAAFAMAHALQQQAQLAQQVQQAQREAFAAAVAAHDKNQKRRKQSKPVRVLGQPASEGQTGGGGVGGGGGGDETPGVGGGGGDLSATMDDDSRSSEASSRLSASAVSIATVADLQHALAIRKRKLSEDDTMAASDGGSGGGGAMMGQQRSGSASSFGGTSMYSVKCPHCGEAFSSEEVLRAHIEEEHVQKLLEKQLQQSGAAYKGNAAASSNGLAGTRQERELAALAASVFQAAGGVPVGGAGGDRRDGIVAGADVEKSFQFPQMPPLVPISQADGRQLQQMMPLSMFSNPMAQFLFPGLPSAASAAAERADRAAPGGQGGSLPPSTPGGMRIFNPEAYCELCNKEFCNKYFLKTHKANKHGIYSVESLVSTPGGYAGQGGAQGPVQGGQGGPAASASLGGPQQPQQPGILSGQQQQQQAAAVAQQQSQHQQHSQQVAQQQGLFSSGVQQMLTEQQQLLALTAGRPQGQPGPQHQQQPGIVNMESFCEICQKEFCNKYFLKKHKQKIHGIMSEPSTPGALVNSGQQPPPSQTVGLGVDKELLLGQGDAKRGPPAAVAIAAAAAAAAAAGVSNEDKSDFLLQLSAKFSATVPTPSRTPPAPSPLSASPIGVLLQEAAGGTGGLVPSNSSAAAGNATPTSCAPLGVTTQGMATAAAAAVALQSPFTPEKLREMGVINPEAFCEICCKEFCNKYFLRTHKANKHGIPDPFQKQTERALQDVPENLTSRGIPAGQPMGAGGGPATANSTAAAAAAAAAFSVALANETEPGMLRSAADFDLSSRNGEFSCDVCQRSFSNQYLLKIHRFYNHSIPYVKQEDQEKQLATMGSSSSSISSSMGGLSRGGHSEFGGSHPTGDGTASPTKKDLSKTEDGEVVMRKPAGLENDPESEMKTKESQKADDGEDDLGTSSPEDAASQDLQKLQSMIRDLTATIANESRVTCNMCRSEFENKYFLRAHMMNEHGVLLGDDGSTTDLFGNSTSAYANVGAGGGVDSEAYCDICQKEFCSKYFLRQHKLNIHQISIDSTTPTTQSPGATGPPSASSQGRREIKSPRQAPSAPATPHAPSTPHGPAADQLNQATQAMQVALFGSPLGGLVPGVQGGLTNSLGASLVGQTTNTSSSGINGTSQLPGAQQQQHHKPSDKPSAPIPQPPSSTANSAAAQRSFVTGRNYCNICNKELCNKYFMKTHMLKMHGINLDEQPADAAKNSIIGGVTCEICQKELCSKYFLKVHKQNTHGIYEDPPKENSLSMVPSDYLFGGSQAASPGDQLTTVMVAAQGLSAASDPASRNLSQYTEVCPLCDRRFKSIKWLKTHMINDHSDTLKENLHAQGIPGSRFPTASADPAGALLALLPHAAAAHTGGSPAPRMCVVCGHAFPDKVALQIHLIKEHRTSSEEQGLMNLSSRPSPSRDTSTPSNDNSNCSVPNISAQLAAAGTGHSMTPFKLSNGTSSPTPLGLRSSSVTAALQQALQDGLFKRPPIAAHGGVGGGGGGHPLAGDSYHHHQLAAASPATKVVYHCAYCAYSTRWLSNLYAHEKRHTASAARIDAAGNNNSSSGSNSDTTASSDASSNNLRAKRGVNDRRFVCRVCHRAYRFSHSLQRHLLSHRSGSVRAIASVKKSSPGSPSPSASAVGKDDPTECATGAAGEQPEDLSKSATPTSLPPPSHESLPDNIKRHYRCSRCARRFESKELCVQHIQQAHSGLRRLASSSTAAAAMSGLLQQRRKRSSVALKPYKCRICGYGTRSWNVLKIHITQQHQPTGSAGHSQKHGQPALVGSVDPSVNGLSIGGLLQDVDPIAQDVSMLEQGSAIAAALSRTVPPVHTPPPGFTGASLNNNGQQLPMTYVIPQPEPTPFILQPFLIDHHRNGGGSTKDSTTTSELKTQQSPTAITAEDKDFKFVPSLVYLPVCRKVSQPMTVAFTLTPA